MLRKRSDWFAWIGGFVFLLVLFRPWGLLYPLNDDWAYWLAARRWAEGGGLRLLDWAPATQVLHLFWGMLFGKMFGAHYGIAKTAVFIAFWFGGVLFLKLLAEEEVPASRRAFAWMTLALSPFVLSLSFTFMSDLPYLAWQIAVFYAFARALREESLRWFWIGGFLSVGAFLVRQIGLFLPLAPIAVLAFERKWNWKPMVAALLPASLAYFGYGVWMEDIHGPTRAYQIYLKVETFARLEEPMQFISESLFRLSAYGVYLGLFLLPVATGYLGNPKAFQGKKGPPASPWTPAVCAMALLVLVCLVLLGGGFPYFENLLTSGGIGTLTLPPRTKISGFFGAGVFFPILTALGLLGAMAGSVLVPTAAFRSNRTVRMLLWGGLFQIVSTLLGSEYFDRYTLLGFPGLLGALFVAGRQWKFSWKFALPTLGLLTILGGIGAWDYHAWNRAKWETGLWAKEKGVAPKRISGGFDWDGFWVYEEGMATLRSLKPIGAIGEWEWMALYPKTGLMAFCHSRPPAGFQEFKRTPYRSPLTGGEKAVCLYLKTKTP